MTSNKNSSSHPESKVPTATQIAHALPILRKRIVELQQIEVSLITQFSNPNIDAIEKKINHVIEDLYGERTDKYYRFCVNLNQSPISMSGPTPIPRIRKGYRDGIDSATSKLNALIEIVEKSPAPLAVEHRYDSTCDLQEARVFVVHGHDHGALSQVARFLEKFSLNVTILHEQPNQGLTLIEKLESNSIADFAVVILTADDVGGEKNSTQQQLKPRARQNVIFELGFFLAKLGRAKVCVLHTEGIVLPSDYQGVLYIPLDVTGSWELKLVKEMKHAGLNVDLNKAA